MQLNKKWLFAAPALGAVLVLGPLAQNQSEQDRSAANRAATQGTPEPRVAPTPLQGPSPDGAEPEPATDRRGIKVGSNAVPMPEPWHVVSTLAGLLILAGIAVIVIARVRKSPRRQSDGIVSLRQSLRLGNKSRLHAIQFEDRLLLLGESEAGVTLLHEIADPRANADEVEVATRDLFAAAAGDGAEPRDLGLIQAARELAARKVAAQQIAAQRQGQANAAAPTQTGAASDRAVSIPRPAASGASGSRPPAAKAAAADGGALNDFRALLRRANAEKVS